MSALFLLAHLDPVNPEYPRREVYRCLFSGDDVGALQDVGFPDFGFKDIVPTRAADLLDTALSIILQDRPRFRLVTDIMRLKTKIGRATEACYDYPGAVATFRVLDG